MSRFQQIARGIQARKAFSLRFDTGGEGDEPIEVQVDVRPLTTGEEVSALAAARAYALAQGLAEPKEGEPIYDLAVMAQVVALATLDHDSPPSAPQTFFDSVDQVLSLDRDRLQMLYEAQNAWQEQCSPRRLKLDATGYISLIALAVDGEAADSDPFFAKLPRATLVSLVRIMGRQLGSSLPPKSPSTSSSSTAGESG